MDLNVNVKQKTFKKKKIQEKIFRMQGKAESPHFSAKAQSTKERF